MNWNKRITEQRTLAKLSKAKFARLVGVSGPTVTDWENGTIKTLAGINLMNVAKVLGVSPDWLLTGKSQPAQHEVNEERAEYSVHSELLAAWDLLTHDDRAEFMAQIKQRASHNKAVMDELSSVRRTVNVNARRRAQAGIKPIGMKGIKDAE